MHDASYWGCVCVRGPIEALGQLLKLVRLVIQLSTGISVEEDAS